MALPAWAGDLEAFAYNYPVSSGVVDGGIYSTALDNDSNLHATYASDGAIKYRYNLGGEETVASGSLPSLAVNPVNKQPAITFISGGFVNYAWRDVSGAWQTFQLATGTVASLAIDSTGLAHVVYLEAGNDNDPLNEIFYTSGFLQNFSSSTLIANGAYCNEENCRVTDNYLKPNIKIDSNNLYHIIALEQYRNDTLVPNHQDYLLYLGPGKNNQGSGETEGAMNLPSQFLSLDPSGQVVATWSRGSEIKTTTFNPDSSNWSGDGITASGVNPNLFFSSNQKSLAYENGGQIYYQKATTSVWGPAINVATGTQASVLSDNYDYVYYLNDGKLYLASTRDVPDISIPTAIFLSNPDALTTETSARFVVGGSDVFAYKYKLDNGSFSGESPVANPIVLGGLTVGGHTVSIIGRDGSNNWQPESSSTNYSWMINAPVVPPPSGGGGGGGGGAAPVAVLAGTTTPEVPAGLVLGARSFRFSRILRPGMSGLDVTELQNILKREGFFKVKVTKYFGPATKQALTLWQKKNKIRPATGVLGKPTIKYLNNI